MELERGEIFENEAGEAEVSMRWKLKNFDGDEWRKEVTEEKWFDTK